MTTSQSASGLGQTAPITTAAEAELVATHLLEVMDGLVDVLEQETALLRAGRLSAACQLEPVKSELSRLYVADTLRLRASSRVVAQMPAAKVAAARARHETFRAMLQTNLTVLATAHAVSEGIVRGVSGELARKSVPQTYCASGTPVAPPRSAGQPLSISRSL